MEGLRFFGAAGFSEDSCEVFPELGIEGLFGVGMAILLDGFFGLFELVEEAGEFVAWSAGEVGPGVDGSLV